MSNVDPADPRRDKFRHYLFNQRELSSLLKLRSEYQDGKLGHGRFSGDFSR